MLGNGINYFAKYKWRPAVTLWRSLGTWGGFHTFSKTEIIYVTKLHRRASLWPCPPNFETFQFLQCEYVNPQDQKLNVPCFHFSIFWSPMDKLIFVISACIIFSSIAWVLYNSLINTWIWDCILLLLKSMAKLLGDQNWLCN